MEDEARFPFDIKNFQKAVNDMSKSVSTIQQKMEGFGKTMTQSVSKAIMGATAKIGLLVKSFKSIMGNMPEIGQAFKIAGSIVSREFFFPIRQKLMPYLQKMLDWVRDHRTLFAKWGQAVADTLNVVIVVAKSLWSVFKDLTTMLTDTLQRALGTSFKTLDEFVAVLQVKVAFAMLLIGEAIKQLADTVSPVFETVISKGAEILKFFTDLLGAWIGINKEGHSLGTIFKDLVGIFDKLMNFALDNLLAIFEGLKPALEGLMTPLGQFVKGLSSIVDKITSLDASPFIKFFVGLGNGILDGISATMSGVGALLDEAAGNKGAVDAYVKAMEEQGKGNSGDGLMFGAVAPEKDGRSGIQKIRDNFKESFSFGGKIDDGIVTKDGKVIQLNPDDNVYAFKGEPRGGDVSVEMSMVFNVQATEGNAQAVGVQLGQSIHDTFAERLKKQMMIRGY